IAIALASHGPIQMGRYRSWSVSLRITTCRLDSMWTRTLSTTISTSPFRACGSSLAMLELSHAELVERPRRTRSRTTASPDDSSDCGAGNEPADVRKERDAARRAGSAEGRKAADQLENEPEAEHDDGRNLEELVEEPEEDEAEHARPRVQHDVRAEDRRDRPRGADHWRW